MPEGFAYNYGSWNASIRSTIVHRVANGWRIGAYYYQILPNRSMPFILTAFSAPDANNADSNSAQANEADNEWHFRSFSDPFTHDHSESKRMPRLN